MEVFEISGFRTGQARDGVNFLEPADSFQNIIDGYVYRQQLQSRRGFSQFGSGALSDGSRVMGIFTHEAASGSQLLAVSQDYLYRFNTTTNAWDQITNAPSVSGGTFGIPSPEDYVSGTSYPYKDGSDRFIFTSRGMTDTYYYNSTDNQVRSFTTDATLSDYSAPPTGALTNAWFVMWFGERLNFIRPSIAGQELSRGVLYSGIRDASGNGDMFDVAGSGQLEADTQSLVVSANILGDYIVMGYSPRRIYILEKTRDAFNPYFIRRVPGPLGVDAPFSGSEWAENMVLLGKKGILATDGREMSRIDNKIPDFVADEIYTQQFDLTYGGFDSVIGQFLFSYVDSDPEAATQDRTLVYNYEESSWAVYKQRFSVFGNTQVGIELAWDDINETNNPSWASWDETEEIWNKIGRTAELEKTLAGDDNGYIYQLNTDNDDYFRSIVGITTGATTTIAVADNPFYAGDLVGIANVEGMTEINNYDASDINEVMTPYEVLSVAGTDIVINVDSQTFTAATPNTGAISKLITFEAETIPFNPWRDKGRRVYVSHIEFLLATDSGYLQLDILQDEEQTPFKTDVLIDPRQSAKAREWITVTVNNEADFMTFKMKQYSLSARVKIPAIRIHASPGGPTNG